MRCVLVVEDDPWIQWMIADDLRDRGFDVLTARDGLEALRCVARIHPDAIVLDLVLPRMSGWEFLRRARVAGTPSPILVITGEHDQALPAAIPPIERYLRKPFDIEELARNVAELVARQPLDAAAPVAARAKVS